ncbi:MAG: hypothetical protein HC923_05665 [Myxococcales bacterium]|nr:hypothetical protein [Myxococcales bacterium]
MVSDDLPKLRDDARLERREQRLQAWGRQMVSTLYMLIRNVKIHSPENAVFLKPIEQLTESVNNVVAMERRLNLHAVDTHVYLNNVRLKFDFGALETVRYLTDELKARDLGGFSAEKSVTSREIREFLHHFTSDARGSADEGGDEAHRLDALRLSRFKRVKEILDKLQEEPDLDRQIDRKNTFSPSTHARSSS